MKHRFILISSLKCILLAAPLLLISLALKLTLPYNCNSIPCLETQSDRPTFYFLGTSRVQRSISPATLKNELPNYDFINLGLPNNSFLYSCKAASNLLKQGSGKKIIFIELTGLALPPSDSYYFLLTPGDVSEVIKQHVSVQCTSEDISGLLFYLFSIHSDIKKVIYPRLNLYGQPEMGFAEDIRDYTGSLKAMLTPESLAIKTRIAPDLLDMYIEVVRQLRKEADEAGSEIQFMLPLMISETSEFNIDMSVYAQLPEDTKWSYSEEFLKTMNKQQYLSDESHLNAAGAVTYSQELSKFIKARFSTRTQE